MGALLRRHYKNEVVQEDKEDIATPPRQENEEGIATPPEAVSALFGSEPDLPVEPIVKEKHHKSKLKE